MQVITFWYPKPQKQVLESNFLEKSYDNSINIKGDFSTPTIFFFEALRETLEEHDTEGN